MFNYEYILFGKERKGQNNIFNFLSQFLYNFCRYFFTYLYQNKTFLLTMKKNPENYTINDVFKYIGDHTFMSLHRNKNTF